MRSNMPRRRVSTMVGATGDRHQEDEQHELGRRAVLIAGWEAPLSRVDHLGDEPDLRRERLEGARPGEVLKEAAPVAGGELSSLHPAPEVVDYRG